MKTKLELGWGGGRMILSIPIPIIINWNLELLPISKKTGKFVSAQPI